MRLRVARVRGGGVCRPARRRRDGIHPHDVGVGGVGLQAIGTPEGKLRGGQRQDDHGEPCHDQPEYVPHTTRYCAYLVIRPIVAISSSTLCLCSITSPEASAPATQCDT